MIGAIFNFIIGFLATVIQLVMWPINQALTAVLPDFSARVTEIGQGFAKLFQALAWPLQLIPISLLSVFLFIFTARLAITVFSASNKLLVRVWNVLDKIKFW